MLKLSIRRVLESEARRAHGFHERHGSEFLWPRDVAYFEELVRAECLFEARNGADETVALAYLKSDEHGIKYELGGIYVRDDCRGCGLADALCTVAISAEYALNAPRADSYLIAHVHESNADPRSLLGRLGFRHVGQIDVPDDIAPASMQKNKDGKLIGHVFDFSFEKCAEHATWLETFGGTIERKSTATLTIDVPFYQDADSREAAVEALREIARGYRSATTR